jgi:hypothetical protein
MGVETSGNYRRTVSKKSSSLLPLHWHNFCLLFLSNEAFITSSRDLHRPDRERDIRLGDFVHIDSTQRQFEQQDQIRVNL